MAALSDCIITGANLTPIQPRVIREDIVLTLCYVARSEDVWSLFAKLVDASVPELWVQADNLKNV